MLRHQLELTELANKTTDNKKEDLLWGHAGPEFLQYVEIISTYLLYISALLPITANRQ